MKGSNIDVVIYHSPCADGHAAASLFYHLNPIVEMIGMHPKNEFIAFDQIYKKNVVLVDIAFSLKTMKEIAACAKNVVVLDHHITNQETLKTLSEPNLECHFVMGKAGVCLAWEYLYPNRKIPKALHYIGLKDVWQHESNQEAVYFTNAFTCPKTWDEWLPFHFDSPQVDEMITKGKILYEYNQSILNTLMEKVRYTTYNGYKIAIINVPFPFISDIGALICQKEPDKMIAVIWNKPADEPYNCSLRSNEKTGPNVAQLAEKLGGGGHIHAAACRLDIPPFEVFTDNGEFRGAD